MSLLRGADFGVGDLGVPALGCVAEAPAAEPAPFSGAAFRFRFRAVGDDDDDDGVDGFEEAFGVRSGSPSPLMNDSSCK